MTTFVSTNNDTIDRHARFQDSIHYRTFNDVLLCIQLCIYHHSIPYKLSNSSTTFMVTIGNLAIFHGILVVLLNPSNLIGLENHHVVVVVG